MIKFFKELFKDGGEISSIRFTLVMGVVMIVFLVGLIGYIVFKQTDMNYIDKIIFAIATIAGIFIAGKVTQKYAEVKGDKNITIENSFDNTKENKPNV